MFKFDVFLSHNCEDKTAVEALAIRLVDDVGLKVFLDKWNLVPGDPWQDDLEMAMEQSRTVAVFLGPSGISGWHNEEMRIALDRRIKDRERRVIPVLLPNTKALEDYELPSFLARLNWVDFRIGLEDEDAFRRLVAGIHGEVPGPGITYENEHAIKKIQNQGLVPQDLVKKFRNKFIYICYSPSDKKLAENLYTQLISYGFDIKTKGLNSNLRSSFREFGEEMILESLAVIICFTTDLSIISDYIFECEIARSIVEKKPIIPIVFPEGKLLPIFEYHNPIMVENLGISIQVIRKLFSRLMQLREYGKDISCQDPPQLRNYLELLYFSVDELIEEYEYSPIELSCETFFDLDLSPKVETLTISPIRKKRRQRKSKGNNRKISRFKNLSDAYKYFTGRILLLGEPGAGKTTSLLMFAKEVIVKRLLHSSAPIPILANITQWNDYLQDIPSALLPEALNGFHLGEYPLLYLLDGIDNLPIAVIGSELKKSQFAELRFESFRDDIPENPNPTRTYYPRKEFIQKIQSQIPNASLVITSRTEDFYNTKEKLFSLNAIKLTPLSDAQIITYLDQRRKEELYKLIESDKELRKIAGNPLLLTILLLVYEENHEARIISSSEEKNINPEVIFDKFIQTRFEHENNYRSLPFNEETTRNYLGDIAFLMAKGTSTYRTEIPAWEIDISLGKNTTSFLQFAQCLQFLNIDIDSENRESVRFIHTKFRDFCALPLILTSFLKEDQDGKEHLAGILGQIGYSAISSLNQYLKNDNLLLRGYSAMALGYIGNPQSQIQLENVLADPGNDSWVRLCINDALKNIESSTLYTE